MQQHHSAEKTGKSVHLVVGAFLVAAGIICLLLNFSLLPVIGTVIGIPCIAIGAFFLIRHRRLSGRGKPEIQKEQ